MNKVTISGSKATRTLHRSNGSEVRITAELGVGSGLHISIGVYVHRRESPDHPWKLTSDRPHPDWRTMSVEEYTKRGRSEMLQTVSHGELLQVTSALAATAPHIGSPPKHRTLHA